MVEKGDNNHTYPWYLPYCRLREAEGERERGSERGKREGTSERRVGEEGNTRGMDEESRKREERTRE